jgi:hydrogenase maturation protease
VYFVFDPFFEAAHRAVLKAPMNTLESSPQIAAVPFTLRVIGCGNELTADDGLGVVLVKRLKDGAGLSGQRPCDFSVVPNAGLELLDSLHAEEFVLFVDAVAGGDPPGTLRLIPLPSHSLEARPVSSLSSHGWGLLETIELAKRLKPVLPRMLLAGIELGTLEFMAPLSPSVERAMQRVSACFPKLLEALGDPAAKLWQEPQRFLPDEPLPWEEKSCA